MAQKNKTSLPRDMIMEIIQNKEMSVDGCRGVAEYDESYIKLNAGRGTVTVFGSQLEIKSYTENSIIISGKLERIEF